MILNIQYIEEIKAQKLTKDINLLNTENLKKDKSNV